MADLSSIEDRLYRIREPGGSWGGNEGFEPEKPLTLDELARMLETVIEEVQTLKSEQSSHADQQHHSPPPF